MTEERGDNDNQQNSKFGNLLFIRRTLWSNFDRWVEEEPSVSRDKFEIVKSAMLVHCEYPALVMNRIGYDEDDETEYDPKPQFINFVNVLNKTRFVSGSGPFPAVNLFVLLSEIFSAEFESDVGVINSFLKSKLSQMLDGSAGWDKMSFSVSLFRSVYWQLLFTLRLAPVESDGETEETMNYDENRPKLMFASFIVAILVSVTHEYENAFILKIPNLHDVVTVPEHMVRLVSSSHFRILSQFFLAGLWILTKYKTQGKYVTVNEDRIYTEKDADKDEKKNRTLLDPNFNPTIGEVTAENVQLQWESFTVKMLKKGILKTPEGCKIVQKGGRPRKIPVPPSRKRKIGDTQAVEEVERPISPQLTPVRQPAPSPTINRFQRREKSQKSPKKRDRRSYFGRKALESPELSPSELLPSTSSAPPTKVKKIYPSLNDVGLSKPIFALQDDLFKNVRAEIERRIWSGNYHPGDDETLKNIVFKGYDEIHKAQALAAKSKNRELTSEQKQVMQRLKKTCRRGNSDDDEEEERTHKVQEEEVEEEEEEEEEYTPRAKKPRSSRGGRGKRKY